MSNPVTEMQKQYNSKVPGQGSPPVAEADIYTVEPTNWFKAKPYGFAFFNRQAKSDQIAPEVEVIYLPILPSNVNVTTHFATNLVTTLFGVVEEHSEVRYYDITISGNTGIAPRWTGGTQKIPSAGKSSFDNKAILEDQLGGFLPEVTNVVNQAVNAVQSIGDSLTTGPTNDTGIAPAESGYLAFHELYKFFLRYKRDTAGFSVNGTTPRQTHPISFLNYKDGLRYDCVPRAFVLTRDAARPMLYNYNITLRAFNLRNVNDTGTEDDQLTKLGLGGMESQSIFSSLTDAAGTAATLVGAVL